jgi:TRAP-type C4-dicarboxylate transport system permease small subunit
MYFIGVVLIYFVILAVLVVSGVLSGYLLQWLIPALSLETSILVGTISVNSALYFFVMLIRSASNYAEKRHVEDNTDTEDEKHIFVLPGFPSDYLGSRRREYLGKRSRKKK